MDKTSCTQAIHSPFGILTLTEVNATITALDWKSPDISHNTPLLREAENQLQAYFYGDLQQFDLPLNPGGAAFQQRVCQAMIDIPYGETTTYGELAQALGTSAQAVGNACGGNTIPIIIPCHRVLAANGTGGYSGQGGVERKTQLLKHEGGFPYLL